MTYLKRNKRFLIGLLTIVFCCSMAPLGQAADVTAAPEPVFQQNFQDPQLINASFADTGRHILLLHENVSWSGLANGQLVGDYGIFMNFNQNGHLLYPVRAISQYLGFTVDWDGEQRSVRLSNSSGHQVIFTMDSSEALVGGEVQSLPIAPAIIDGKVMLPIRALVEALGGSISYEQGLLVLSDRQDPFTEAEAASLDKMKLAYLQSQQESLLSDSNGSALLAQSKGHAYWRQGLDQLYIDADGARQSIDLGPSVQLILGIDKDKVYYITGEDDAASSRLLNGQLCRADLTGGQRQVLMADFYGYTQSTTKFHAALHTYFLHGRSHDYLIVREGSMNLGSYNLYQLDDEQAVEVDIKLPENVYIYGMDQGFSDPLVFGDELYHFSNYMGTSPGLYHLQLRPDGTAAVQDKFLPELAFYKIIALDDHQLLALAEPYQQELKEHCGSDIYQVDLHAMTVSQLTNEHIPFFSRKQNILVLTNDGHVLYYNQAHELCQIPLLTP